MVTKYDDARPIFLLGKMSADRILADPDPETHRLDVSVKLNRLFGHLIYFEGRVPRPKTLERIGRMNKRRIGILKSVLVRSDLDGSQKILILQVTL